MKVLILRVVWQAVVASRPVATSDSLRARPAREVIEWVRSSCEHQGVPVKVTDAKVIDKVAALLGEGGVPGSGEAGAQAVPAPFRASRSG